MDEIAVRAISVNAAANGVRVTPVRADLLDGDGNGADLCCAPTPSTSRIWRGGFLAFLHGMPGCDGARVLAGDPGRAFLRTAGFTPVARYEIPVTIALEGMTAKRATVYEVTAEVGASWPSRPQMCCVS